MRNTPASRLREYIRKAAVGWLDDARDPVKAYAFACLSELAYLHLTDHELEARDRYKLFAPSIANARLRRLKAFVPLEVLLGPAELPVEVFDTVDYVYAVMRLEGAWVVAVRGTHGLADLVRDFRATKISTGKGRFHKGFGREALTARPLLEQRVADDQPIYFTGHSMGAAVAAILRHEWQGANRIMTPYLFAPPHFADGATPRLPTYSYVRPWDMVPHVPPRAFGYAPHSPRPMTVPSAARQHGALLCTLISFDQLFATHSMEGYRAGLCRDVAGRLGGACDESVYLRLLEELKRSP